MEDSKGTLNDCDIRCLVRGSRRWRRCFWRTWRLKSRRCGMVENGRILSAHPRGCGSDDHELCTRPGCPAPCRWGDIRSEEHTSELQSLMRISYAVFCLKKKNKMTMTNTKNV